jgi:hypothetical protein
LNSFPPRARVASSDTFGSILDQHRGAAGVLTRRLRAALFAVGILAAGAVLFLVGGFGAIIFLTN